MLRREIVLVAALALLRRGRIMHQSTSAAVLADGPPLERFPGVTAR